MHLLRRRPRALSAIVLVALIVAACGGDDDDASAPADSDASTSTPAPDAAASCTGEPIRFTQIVSLTGPFSLPSSEFQIDSGLTAALTAITGECATGRPIEINVCDDRSDPNEATSCGRDAAADGSLALVGSTGLYEQGPAAAGLPAIFVSGATQFDLTNERALSVQSGIELILGSVTAAAASGREHYVMLTVDNALFRLLMPTLQGMAEEAGIEMSPLYFPPETTDFAPVAAQARQMDPDAIGLIVTAILPAMNALAAEGLSAQEMPIFTSVSLVAPEVRRELGDVAEGMYLITQQVPPTVTDNEGIAQMREEFQAAGLDPDNEDLSPLAVSMWSTAHLVEEALATLTPDQIASLDPDAVLEAARALSPIDRPEMAPVDFSAPAFPDLEALAPFRLFSRHAMVVHIEDGEYVPVSDFVDVTTPFELELAG